MLDALDNSPYKDNTIVVLWSDNGYHLGEKFHWAKHTFWNRTTHIPFIWAGPGVPKNITKQQVVGLIDIYPTLVEICGLSSNQKLDGKSLTEFFTNDSKPQPRHIVTSKHDTNSVVTNNWRYIKYKDNSCELYNRVKDPNEWKNLAKKKKLYRKIIEQLDKKLPQNPAKPATSNRALKLKFKDETFTWIKRENFIPKKKYKKRKKKNLR